MKQSIRIIGGQFRGKKLTFPAIDGLRPTPSRVRETLFNWLMHDIRDAHCLDAFAGSGALGIEAYSRGAAHVTMLEQHPIAYANIQHQVTSFDPLKLDVRQVDACFFLQQTQIPFDIIFLDPPFATNHLNVCMDILSARALLKPQGLVYLESANVINVDHSMWEQIKSSHAGQIHFGLYKKR